MKRNNKYLMLRVNEIFFSDFSLCKQIMYIHFSYIHVYRSMYMIALFGFMIILFNKQHAADRDVAKVVLKIK